MEISDEMLRHFAALSPGDCAVYHVLRGGALETLYLSENVPSLLEMTREEYLAITARDAMDLTLPADRRGLQEATAACVRTGEPFDYYYRVFHRRKGFEWVHVHAHICGEMDGTPLILALFSNMTAEGSIFQQLLDASDRKVLVIDRVSRDILYANEPAAQDDAGVVRSLLDQTCYGFLHGFDAPCKNCILQSGSEESSEEVRFDEDTGKWEHLTRRFVSWCGHSAMFVCIKDITAERCAELEIERYRQMYSDATQEAKLIVWTYEAETHRAVMLWDGYTKEICRRLGVPSVIENVPEALAQFVDPRDRDAFVDMYRKIDGGARRSGCEFRFQLPQQPFPQYERAVASSIYDESGRRIGVYCFGQNITAQKQEEEKYQRAIEELGKAHLYSLASYHLNLTRDLCEQEERPSANASQIWKSGRVDDFFAVIAGLIDDETKKAEFNATFRRDALLAAFSRGTEKFSVEYPSVGPDGVRRWREGLLFLMRNPRTGDVEGVSYAMDIDARKRGELVLQKLIYENFDYIGLLHPSVSTFEFVSRSNWIGYGSIGEALDYGRCCAYVASLFDSEEERSYFSGIITLEHILQALRSGGGQTTETYFRTSDGKALCVRLTYRWLEEPEGDILVLRSDITDSYEQEKKRLARMQLALEAADRANEEKSLFLSTMSHDLRTPLNGVLSFTDFALQETDPDKKQAYLQKIKYSGDLLLALVNDTLELSRIESGKVTLQPEAVPIREVGRAVIEALRPVAEAKGVKLEAGTSPDSYIFVDKLKYQKIWLNLLSNAIKYTPAGGTVRAFVEPIDPPESGRNRRIIVEDTGIGMSEEFMARMFEPFTQENRPESGNAGGTGLGLAIVKRLVDLLGGTISVRSRPGEGTRFEIEVPVQTVDGPAVGSESTAADAAALNGMSVLLCEDNPLNREIAETLLKNRGVAAACAENGQVGLHMFENSAPGQFRAVLMDIRMPVLGGCEAARAIRALDRPDAKTVPIIAMTADAFEESIQAAAEAGMNSYLTKPIVPEKLYELLAAAVRTQQAENGAPHVPSAR